MSESPHKSSSVLVRWCLLGIGVLCTGLAAAGTFLPMVPTTPFLLLAAACFLRSSPDLHRRLLASPMFGPFLSQWQRDRTVSRAAKIKAYCLVAVTFPISIALVDPTWLRILLAVLGIGLVAFLSWLPSAPRGKREQPSPSPIATPHPAQPLSNPQTRQALEQELEALPGPSRSGWSDQPDC